MKLNHHEHDFFGVAFAKDTTIAVDPVIYCKVFGVAFTKDTTIAADQVIHQNIWCRFYKKTPQLWWTRVYPLKYGFRPVDRNLTNLLIARLLLILWSNDPFMNTKEKVNFIKHHFKLQRVGKTRNVTE